MSSAFSRVNPSISILKLNFVNGKSCRSQGRTMSDGGRLSRVNEGREPHSIHTNFAKKWPLNSAMRGGLRMNAAVKEFQTPHSTEAR
jgi:hypothetical protein